MNILVADSGSTKTEWIYSKNSGKETTILSEGLNPYFKDSYTISEVVRKEVVPGIDGEVNQIFFYGAGCSSPVKQLQVLDAFRANFKKAKIHVDTDLMGAAIACFGDNAGVACILGTGSNTCVYDGEKINARIPSLGFTLGDEGSGGYFGKKILRAYFYKTMPEDVRTAMDEQRDMNLEHILDRVYHHDAPNRFVASFARMLADYSDHPFIKQTVEEGFTEFIDQQLGYFGDSIKNMDIGFVGSIAKIHAESLEKILLQKGYNAPKVIVQKPIGGILRYHKNKNRS